MKKGWNFLVSRCRESDAWAWGVLLVGCGLMIAIALM